MVCNTTSFSNIGELNEHRYHTIQQNRKAVCRQKVHKEQADCQNILLWKITAKGKIYQN